MRLETYFINDTWKFNSYLPETTTTAPLVILFNALWEVIANYEACAVNLRAKHTVREQLKLIYHYIWWQLLLMLHYRISQHCLSRLNYFGMLRCANW
jgi:hypothetical protein